MNRVGVSLCTKLTITFSPADRLQLTVIFRFVFFFFFFNLASLLGWLSYTHVCVF